MQRGIVLAVRGLEGDITAETPAAAVKAMVAETPPPKDLCQVELAQLPSFYKDIRAWLVSHGVTMGPHPSRRITHIVSEYLYDDSDDKTLAHDMVRMILDNKMRIQHDAPLPAAPPVAPAVGAVGAAATPACITELANPTTRILTRQLSSRYRHDDQKFCGGEDKAFHEVVAGYQQLMRSLVADHDQKMELIYLVLGGEAKSFDDEKVEGQVVTFAEAVDLIGEKFNPEITQTQTYNKLGLLRVNQCVRQGRDVGTAGSAGAKQSHHQEDPSTPSRVPHRPPGVELLTIRADRRPLGPGDHQRMPGAPLHLSRPLLGADERPPEHA